MDIYWTSNKKERRRSVQAISLYYYFQTTALMYKFILTAQQNAKSIFLHKTFENIMSVYWIVSVITTISIFEPLRCLILFNVTNGPFCLHLLGGRREREVARSGPVPLPQMGKQQQQQNRQQYQQTKHVWRSKPYLAYCFHCQPFNLRFKQKHFYFKLPQIIPKTFIKIILSDKRIKTSGRRQKLSYEYFIDDIRGVFTIISISKEEIPLSW